MNRNHLIFRNFIQKKISKYKSVSTGVDLTVLSWAVLTKVPLCWKLDVIQDGDGFVLIRSKQLI